MNSACCRSVLLLLFLLTPLAAAETVNRSELVEQASSLRAEDHAAAAVLLDEALADMNLDTLAEDELRDVAALLRMRAELHRGAAEYAEAAAQADRFAVVAEKSGDAPLLAEAKFLRGTVEAEQGRLAQALEYFHSARQDLEGIGEPGALAQIYNAIGITHNFAGDSRRAYRYFNLALEQARAEEDNRLIATYLNNLSLVAVEVEGPEAALALQQEVLTLAGEMGDDSGAALARGNMCNQLVDVGRLEDAEPVCSQALEEIDQLGQTRWRAGVRQTIGNLHRGQGELELALEMYRDSLALAEGVVATVEEEVLSGMAEVLVDLGRLEEAMTTLQRLLALREEMEQNQRRELLEELEVRYELERSAADVELLRLEAQLQSTRISQRNQLLIALLVILFIALLSAAGATRSYRIKSRLERDLAARNRALEEALDRITELARRDSLTGLLNRRAMEELGEREVARQRRDKSDLTVVLLDVDFFKSVNDRYGHGVGDEVLKGLAEVLRNNLRDCDLVGRWGGEEFLCVLPGSDPDKAEQAALRIRSALETTALETSAGPLRLTLSFGIAAVSGRLDQAIAAADAAMYRAKAGGRDAIVRADDGAGRN